MGVSSYLIGTIAELSGDFTTLSGFPYDPESVLLEVANPSGYVTSVSGLTHSTTGHYSGLFEVTSEGEYTYTFTGETVSDNYRSVISNFFIGVEYDGSQLDYLIPSLRLHLGDSLSLGYSTDILRNALIQGFKALIPRWQRRYAIDSDNNIRRTSNYVFPEAEPPVILVEDERPLVLMASIILKRGNLQSSASSLGIGSWRDDEISMSNIESSKTLEASLARDENELDQLLPPRTKKLAKASKQSLLGFDYPRNIYEGTKDWH